MGRVSRAAWIYIAAVVVAAASVVAPSLSGPPMGTGWWLSLGVLMLLFLICDSAPTPLAARQSAWSPSSSATLAAVVAVVGVTVQPDGAFRPRLMSLAAPGPLLASVALTVVVVPEVVTRLLDGLIVSWVAAGSAACAR